MASSTLHPSEHDLELYCLGRLAEPDLARVEEHVTTCARCRNSLAEQGRFVRAVRRAMRAIGYSTGQEA